MFVLCCIMLCVRVFSNIISHSNLERMKMFCAFRLHDYCGTTQLYTVNTMMVYMCMCVRVFVCPDVCYFSFFNVFVSSFLSFWSTSYSCNPLSSIFCVLYNIVFQSLTMLSTYTYLLPHTHSFSRYTFPHPVFIIIWIGENSELRV